MTASESDDEDRSGCSIPYELQFRNYSHNNSYRNAKFIESSVWIPVAIGISIAAGVLTTKGIQRLFNQGSQTVSRSAATATETATHTATNATAGTTSKMASELPLSAQTSLTAKTFTGQLPYGGNFKDTMDISEAALILGCRETSSKKIVNQRFQQLMKSNHPDQGGSPYVATKINEAKVLVGKNKD